MIFLLMVVFTERSGRSCPPTISGRDQVFDDPTDIFALCGIVVRTGVIARHRHCPTLVTPLQVDQKSCRIINIPARVEHGAGTGELPLMVVMVDLHAAQINQFAAGSAGPVECLERLRQTPSKNGFAFYIERIGLQRPSPPGFRQSHRIENPDRHAMFAGCSDNLPLTQGRAGSWRRRGSGLKDKQRRRHQCVKDCRLTDLPIPDLHFHIRHGCCPARFDRRLVALDCRGPVALPSHRVSGRCSAR